MSKLFKSFMTVAAFAAITFVSSCTKTCDEGFEGDKCDTEIRAKFLGNWKGTDVCTTGTYTDITITNEKNSGDVLKVSIKNIGGFGATEVITATVNGSELTFTNQSLSGDRTISGSLTLESDGSLSSDYTVTPAVGVADACEGTFEKL